MSACRSACHRNNFRKSRVSDVSAKILVRNSVSVSASWNAGLTRLVTHAGDIGYVNLIGWSVASVILCMCIGIHVYSMERTSSCTDHEVKRSKVVVTGSRSVLTALVCMSIWLLRFLVNPSLADKETFFSSSPTLNFERRPWTKTPRHRLLETAVHYTARIMPVLNLSSVFSSYYRGYQAAGNTPSRSKETPERERV